MIEKKKRWLQHGVFKFVHPSIYSVKIASLLLWGLMYGKRKNPELQNMIRESFPMCVSSFTILMKLSVNVTLPREDLDFSHCWKTFSISFLCQMCVYSFLLWHWFEWTPRQLCGRKTWQILKQLHLVYWPGESSYRLENVISVHPSLWTRGDQLLKDRWSLSQFLGDFTSSICPYKVLLSDVTVSTEFRPQMWLGNVATA